MAESSASLCGSTGVFYYPALQAFPKTIYIFACVITVLISVSSVLGNTLILSALRQCQSLHSPSKALLCSLALTDLVVGLVVLPLYFAYYLTIILEMPTYFCSIGVSYGRTASFIAAASLFTTVTIAAERFLAFQLRLRYRVIVTFKRVVFILVLEWIGAALWACSWFFSESVSVLIGAVILLTCCLLVPLCYLSIYRGLRRHFAQIHQQPSASEPNNFNALQYRKNVTNMVWIYGFLMVCYIPFLSAQIAILVAGHTGSTRFAIQFTAIAIYFNSSLNPVLYCWRIKELREKMNENYVALRNFFSSS